MDLDHFKQVNDNHGHRTGDLALQAFAEAVRSRLTRGGRLARMGGEEFGLILPGTDAVGARATAETVRQAVEALDLQDAQGRRVHLTVSAGVAVSAPGHSRAADFSVGSLYSRADEALYRAKKMGRNRVECAAAEVSAVTTSA
jgi:diguanylate cyclase (GGDEF)-like protein